GGAGDAVQAAAGARGHLGGLLDRPAGREAALGGADQRGRLAGGGVAGDRLARLLRLQDGLGVLLTGPPTARPVAGLPLGRRPLLPPVPVRRALVRGVRTGGAQCGGALVVGAVRDGREGRVRRLGQVGGAGRGAQQAGALHRQPAGGRGRRGVRRRLRGRQRG